MTKHIYCHQGMKMIKTINLLQTIKNRFHSLPEASTICAFLSTVVRSIGGATTDILFYMVSLNI